MPITPRPQLKRLAKATAWLLIMTIIANILNAMILPQTARAADPNMYLFWDGTCTDAAMPSGWSLVSDANGEAFYDTTNGGLFPRGNSSYTRNAGGALTHTHTGTGSSTAATATDRKTTTGATHNSTSHTHPVTVDSVSSVSSLPGYENLCVIKYSGLPSGASAIPSGAIAIFDAAVPGANWSDISSNFATNNEFIRGNSSAGGTGGSNSHQGTGHSVSGTLTGVAGTTAKSGTTATRSSLANHTHTASGTSNTPDTQPPYITIILGKATANTSIPQKMIAMFDGSSFDTYGWEVLSNSGGPFYQKFLKVTGSYGSTGGAAQHTHAAINATSTASASDTGGTGSGTIPGHQHPVTFNLADGTNTNLPPYTDIVIAKKSYIFYSLTTDQPSYPTLGQTITADAQVNNDSATNLTSTKIDYVIFIDANADNQPTSGETYITANCAGSGSWSSGNYTWQKTGLNVNAGSNATDQQSCANSNFPQNTTYHLWGKWYNSGGTVTYDTKYTTFTSVPTLTELLFLALVGCMVFLGVKQGIIKLNFTKKDKYKP